MQRGKKKKKKKKVEIKSQAYILEWEISCQTEGSFSEQSILHVIILYP